MYVPQPTFIPAKGLSYNSAAVRPSTTPNSARTLAGTPFIPIKTTIIEQAKEFKYRITRELLAAGSSNFGLKYAEAKLLPKVLHPDEHIKAVVYGRGETGLAMMVATNFRIIFLDKKPLFIQSDELTYDIVGGVKYSRSLLIAQITLHTRIGDFTIRTFNNKAAEKFRNFIEDRCLENHINHDASIGYNAPISMKYA